MKKWIFVLVTTLSLSTLLSAPFDVESPQSEEMLHSLLKLQKEHMLDGTVLLAHGTEQVVILDNSKDGLDPAQGLRSQYVLASSGKQMVAAACLKALSQHTKDVEKALNSPLSDFFTTK